MAALLQLDADIAVIAEGDGFAGAGRSDGRLRLGRVDEDEDVIADQDFQTRLVRGNRAGDGFTVVNESSP